MVEQNPLHHDIPVSSSTIDEVNNKKGRPCKENIIRFGPEPQSMISKLLKLNNTKADDGQVVMKLSHNSISSAIIPTNEDGKHTMQAEYNHTDAANHNQSINKKGRPIKGKVTHFSPQPQSMVSKSLCNLKVDCIVPLTNEKHDCDTISIPSTPTSKLESEETEDDVYPKKPKRRKRTKKVNVPGQPKTYSCDFQNCPYLTKLASNMTKHKRIHTEEKPYLCDRCSFRSNFINSLKSHKRLHTEVRPYKCSDCSYSCNSISNLKKHCHKRHKNEPFVKNLEQ